MDKTIYHISKTPNIKTLEPRVCSHGKAYVYGTYHIETALLFGGNPWTDWDFIYKRNYETGELTFSETYAGAFNKTFKDKQCYLYEVENSGFLEGQTHMWDEIVSENPTKTLKETKIDNLAEAILALGKTNKIKLELFNNSLDYNEKIKKHILNLSKYSDIYNQNNSETLLKHFEFLIKQSEKLVGRSKKWVVNM